MILGELAAGTQRAYAVDWRPSRVSQDGQMTWAAIRRAFALTLRASEYGASDAVGTDKGNGARG
eukprot:7264848-Heterocapsa_arctica.AAC.1